MSTSNIKLITTIAMGSLLLPLTVHATVISSQVSSQEMSSLTLLSVGILGLLLGRRRIEKE